VGTSSAYIFNKPSGVYQLIVVATNGVGESRSGCCRVTVARSLSADVWTGGRIADANGEDWYSFPVISGTSYYIWWNDGKQGNGTRTGDIAVSARYENETTFIFGGTNTTVDSGWITTEAQSFTATQTGTVYLRVIPYNRSGSNTGTYGIVYNTSETRVSIYTVTFDINGGSGTRPVARTVYAGSGIIIPGGSELSRSGYAFVGWNTNASGTGDNYNPGSPYTPTDNITLYAKWHRTRTVTFHANGESGTPPAAQTVLDGNSITIPDRGGLTSRYTFGNWNGNASGTGNNYNPGATYTPTGDVTLYARWYSTVPFSTNGGIGMPPATQSVNKGSSITVPARGEISKNDYESWGGWDIGNPGDSYTPTGNVTVYAQWIPYQLVNRGWHNGTLSPGVNDIRYSFPVTAGTRYYIWWNDREGGNGSKTATIWVSVSYSDGMPISTQPLLNGWGGWDFTASHNGTVYLYVTPYNNSSAYSGSYGIAYSSGLLAGIRP
jgi:uncharacterized repeat protein (TIGR02543 family)